jgi:hypothetical protein
VNKLVLILVLLLAAPAVRAALHRQEEGAGQPASEDALKLAMETIEHGLGRLRRALREDQPDVEGGLAAVAGMQEATLRAKLLLPPMAAGVPEAERAGFVREYRRMLVELATAELALEAALLEGDLPSARERFQEVRAFEDAGHERFTEDG